MKDVYELSDFNIGDQIICLDSGNYSKYLTLHKTYYINEISFPYLFITDDQNIKRGFFSRRFIPLSKYRLIKIIKIFKNEQF